MQRLRLASVRLCHTVCSHRFCSQSNKDNEPKALTIRNVGLDGGTEVGGRYMIRRTAATQSAHTVCSHPARLRVQVVGAKLEIVTSMPSLVKLLEDATARRATGVNNMHSHSSRSHVRRKRLNLAAVASLLCASMARSACVDVALLAPLFKPPGHTQAFLTLHLEKKRFNAVQV